MIVSTVPKLCKNIDFDLTDTILTLQFLYVILLHL